MEKSIVDISLLNWDSYWEIRSKPDDKSIVSQPIELGCHPFSSGSTKKIHEQLKNNFAGTIEKFQANNSALFSLVENSLLSFMLPYNKITGNEKPVWDLIQIWRAQLSFYRLGKIVTDQSPSMSLYTFIWVHNSDVGNDNRIPKYIHGHVIYGDYGFRILDFEELTINKIRDDVAIRTGKFLNLPGEYGHNDLNEWKIFGNLFGKRDARADSEKNCGNDIALGLRIDYKYQNNSQINEDGEYYLWNHQVPDDGTHDFHEQQWGDTCGEKNIQDRIQSFRNSISVTNDTDNNAIFSIIKDAIKNHNPVCKKRFSGGFSISSKLPNGSLKLENIVIDGSLDLSGHEIKGNLVIENLYIKGEIDLSKIRIHGDLIFDHVSIEPSSATKDENISIDLTNAQIGGEFKINQLLNAEGQIKADNFNTKSISLKNIETCGTISLKDSICTGSADFINIRELSSQEQKCSFNADGLDCKGNFTMAGGFLRQKFTMRNSRIGGELAFKNETINEKMFILKIREISLVNSRINGDLRVTALHICENFDLSGAAIEGSVYFHPARWLSDTKDRFVRTDIGSDLNLSGIKMKQGSFDARALRVIGSVNLLTSETGPFIMSVGHVMFAKANIHEKKSIRPEQIVCSIGRLMIANSLINGWLRMPMIQVTGIIDTYNRKGIYIEEAIVDGSVVLWSSRVFRDNEHEELQYATSNSDIQKILAFEKQRNYPSSWNHASAVHGLVKIQAKVEGDIYFTRIAVEGPINISKCEVRGDIQFASLSTELNRKEINHRDREYLLTENKIHNHSKLAVAHQLCMEMVICSGDIDLTGLRILIPKNKAAKTEINARQLNSKGDLILYEKTNPDLPELSNFTENLQELDLSGVMCHRLVVSSKSFAKDCYKYSGLILRRAHFAKIEIPEEKINRDATFNVPLDLGDAIVDNWDLWDHDKVEYFIMLLSKDRCFKRSNYSNIENFLRNKGYNREADRVYCEMQKEISRRFRRDWLKANIKLFEKIYDLFREKIHKIALFNKIFYILNFFLKSILWIKIQIGFITNQILRCFWGVFLSYGTSWGKPLLFITLLWFLSLPVYQNFQYITFSNEILSIDALSRKANDKFVKNNSIDSNIWNIDNAISISLRYHVPVISILTQSDYTLRDDLPIKVTCTDIPLITSLKNLCIAKYPEKLLILKITPDNFGTIVLLLNWMLWPAFLSIFIRWAIKQQ